MPTLTATKSPQQDFSQENAFYVIWPFEENPIVFAGPITNKKGKIINKYFLDIILDRFHSDDPDADWIIKDKNGDYKINYGAFEDDIVDGISGPHKALEINVKADGLDYSYDKDGNLWAS